MSSEYNWCDIFVSGVHLNASQGSAGMLLMVKSEEVNDSFCVFVVVTESCDDAWGKKDDNKCGTPNLDVDVSEGESCACMKI